MKKLLSALMASSLLVAGSQVVVAQTYEKKPAKKVRPTYTYAGVKYTTQSLDDYEGNGSNKECTQDGLNINGSYDFGNQFFARGSFTDVSGDEACGSSSLNVSGGYKVAWGATSHVYGLLGFQNVSPDNGSGDSGLVLGGGIRGYVVQGIEAYFEVEHSTVFDGETSANFGGAYWFNKNFSVTGDIGIGAEQRSLAIGGRMSF
ncbi:hypothetical protein [Marinagarivorans algicola]|uniref:hypothetical protein n=1 Tax=Marinagarivorans algicola TaxID=1513270 RepID=UPI0006B4961C|nr:hypothetical protein [Marinagarivorans algicola]